MDVHQGEQPRYLRVGQGRQCLSVQSSRVASENDDLGFSENNYERRVAILFWRSRARPKYKQTPPLMAHLKTCLITCKS